MRADDVELPNEASRIGLMNFDVRFRLPSGDAAIARLRHPAGLSVWELNTGERPILYSGRRPFRCPCCRNAVASYATVCDECGAGQPTNDARLAVRLRHAIVQSIASANLLFFLVGVMRILSYRGAPTGALATLRRAQIEEQFPNQFNTSTTAGFHAGAMALLQTELVGIATLMMIVFGIALLAFRAPLLAAWLQCAFIACLVLMQLSTGVDVPVLSWLLWAAFSWGAYRTVKAALDLRSGRYSMPPRPPAAALAGR